MTEYQKRLLSVALEGMQQEVLPFTRTTADLARDGAIVSIVKCLQYDDKTSYDKAEEVLNSNIYDKTVEQSPDASNRWNQLSLELENKEELLITYREEAIRDRELIALYEKKILEAVELKSKMMSLIGTPKSNKGVLANEETDS